MSISEGEKAWREWWEAHDFGNKAPATPCPKARMRGLGDLIARITKAFGVSSCCKCRRRQEWLNRMIPFRKVARSPERA